MPSPSVKPLLAPTIPVTGMEWVVEAGGCDPEILRDQFVLQTLCETILDELSLTIVGEPLWHRFPGAGGVTGLYLLAESHLACHTYPECGFATFNLYCCRPRTTWPWERALRERLGAKSVQVREFARGCPLPESEGGR